MSCHAPAQELHQAMTMSCSLLLTVLVLSSHDGVADIALQHINTPTIIITHPFVLATRMYQVQDSCADVGRPTQNHVTIRWTTHQLC